MNDITPRESLRMERGPDFVSVHHHMMRIVTLGSEISPQVRPEGRWTYLPSQKNGRVQTMVNIRCTRDELSRFEVLNFISFSLDGMTRRGPCEEVSTRGLQPLNMN